MNEQAMQGPLTALTKILPPKVAQELYVRRLAHALPIWVEKAFGLYSINLHFDKSTFPITLLEPKKNIPFELLLGAKKVVEKATNNLTVIIADRLNPRYRPVFVKNQIPFIYKDETVFIPQLALLFAKTKPFEVRDKLNFQNKEKPLSPTAFKITAALLTEQLNTEFRLHDLHNLLVKKHKHEVSSSKLSQNLAELVDAEVLEAYGAGPTRIFKAVPKPKIWELLHAIQIAPFFRTIHSNYVPKKDADYVMAGETALANCTDLAQPKTLTIAVVPSVFRELQIKGKPYGDFDKPTLIEVWKEDPHLFAVDNNINPIELYFSMRRNADERVQIALEKMLKEFDLKPIEK